MALGELDKLTKVGEAPKHPSIDGFSRRDDASLASPNPSLPFYEVSYHHSPSPAVVRELHARVRHFAESLEAQEEELKRLRKKLELSRYGFQPIFEHLTAGQQLQLDVFHRSVVSFYVPSETVILSVNKYFRNKSAPVTFPEMRDVNAPEETVPKVKSQVEK